MTWTWKCTFASLWVFIIATDFLIGREWYTISDHFLILIYATEDALRQSKARPA